MGSMPRAGLPGGPDRSRSPVSKSTGHAGDGPSAPWWRTIRGTTGRCLKAARGHPYGFGQVREIRWGAVK